MHSICVFCGSSSGVKAEYRAAAVELGAEVARRNLTLVYGGANVGLMGALADAAIDAGGRVVGLIPRSLVGLEIAHQNLSELHVVGSMHERKALMFDLSDAFVALPGGFGTLDELFEVLTWAQLGMHGKPVVLLNVAGYFDALLALIDHMVDERLLRPQHRAMVLVAPTVEDAFTAIEGYHAVSTPKLIDRTQG